MKKTAILILLLMLISCATQPVNTDTTTQQPEQTLPTTEPNTTQAKTQQNNTTTTQTATTQSATGKGKLYIGIKDKALDTKDITSIKITINTIHLINDKEEITEIQAENEEFDLLELNAQGITGLLGTTEIEEGNYKEIRIFIKTVNVNKAEQENQAKLPSNVLKLKGNIIIEKEKTTSATIDFEADKSLHITGQGRIIFAPVIKFEVQTDTTAQTQGKQLLLGTGTPRTSITLGMTTEGDLIVNGGINPETPLTWENNKLTVGEVKTETRILSKKEETPTDATSFGAGQTQGRRFTEGLTKTPECLKITQTCKETCMGSACKYCDNKC